MVKVGEYEVVKGVYYSKHYLWVCDEEGKVRIGVTDYAQKRLSQMMYVQLPSPGYTLKTLKPFGALESVKAISDLIAPLEGTVVSINEELFARPQLINDDPYGKGWLVVVSPIDLERELENLMDFNEAVVWHRKLERKG